jgi:hypothetical protein
MDPAQRQAFKEAVRRKEGSSRQRSTSHRPAQTDESTSGVTPAAEEDLIAPNRPQDRLDA